MSDYVSTALFPHMSPEERPVLSPWDPSHSPDRAGRTPFRIGPHRVVEAYGIDVPLPDDPLAWTGRVILSNSSHLFAWVDVSPSHLERGINRVRRGEVLLVLPPCLWSRNLARVRVDAWSLE